MASHNYAADGGVIGTKAVHAGCFNSDESALKPQNPSIQNPSKNRLHDYEAGWLTLLFEMGMATKKEAHDAVCRVAQAAIDKANERRERRRKREPE